MMTALILAILAIFVAATVYYVRVRPQRDVLRDELMRRLAHGRASSQVLVPSRPHQGSLGSAKAVSRSSAATSSSAPESSRGGTVTHPLEARFEDLSFPLPCNGRTYTVAVERIHCQPLHPGMIEWSPEDDVEPEDCDFMFKDVREAEERAIKELTRHLTELWGKKRSWTVLTPLPDHRCREFRESPRIFGRLSAAVLVSSDKWFPQDADYSEACVIFTTLADEGLLPERVRALIDWEALAIPQIV